ncbi:glucose-6-phosphate isomerase [Paremcibacter congregatus]|uniref:Glucose-6-phosphate isomerase n=1 Tax=Paremcibacter congregatus TaxID=2043170 RepID=A0A2G4YRZ8_9PROT|nr:glucose-6-phosphate isomerase [Paremcibacter congregatus]PHZ85088.1 glucose-6-phosphate isomerase [Paremcibacter congregatus]QDE27962.1 glucose-6-phosphate isomerase [Paremcibacter congregatus]
MNTQTTSWRLLDRLRRDGTGLRLNDLFANDPARFEKYALQVENILFDYSKNLVTDDIMAGLFDLAREVDVEGWRDRMFSGDRINVTEDRPVLHVALRNISARPILVDGIDVMEQVSEELDKMKRLTDAVRSGKWRGYSGKPITDVVNIGIGGSNLGPQMVTEALQKYSDNRIRVHYVSNVDGVQIAQVLRPLNPEQVLFVISSKTFTTRETLTNAETARNWLLASSFEETALEKHFIAVTANRNNALKFGLPQENIHDLWDWVGGRFSLWSAIGLPIALSLGFEHFESLLGGAYAMDRHFEMAPMEQNAPVIQALIGIWNSTFLGMQSQAILPYNQSLHMFSAYLQQADMESNGKSVDWDGNDVPYSTGSIIWGQLGINGQHAFYQYLHQGKNIVPADFIGAVESSTSVRGHHEYLMANFIAQTQALMTGIDETQVRAELRAKGKSEAYINNLVSHKIHQGNRPTNTILMERIDPHTLGALIALYEHKIFVQGIIWKVCSFDQWGVELGKELAHRILPQLDQNGTVEPQDSSTTGLIDFYKNVRKKS